MIANLGPTGPRAAGQLKSPISTYPELVCKYGSAMSHELVSMGRPIKCSKNSFSELGLPGVEIVNGLCRNIFDNSRPPQLPYNEQSET